VPVELELVVSRRPLAGGGKRGDAVLYTLGESEFGVGADPPERGGDCTGGRASVLPPLGGLTRAGEDVRLGNSMVIGGSVSSRRPGSVPAVFDLTGKAASS
jgi:hypothetical protein